MQVQARHAPPNSQDMSSGPKHSASEGQPSEPPPVVGSWLVAPCVDEEDSAPADSVELEVEAGV